MIHRTPTARLLLVVRVSEGRCLLLPARDLKGREVLKGSLSEEVSKASSRFSTTTSSGLK